MSIVLPPGVAESSGTAVAPVNDDPNISLEHRRASTPTSSSAGEEQALELHEVIELQTFSERKAWIENKIKVSTFTSSLAAHLIPSSS
jgi:hypothetical protein